jgi:hypothetical protein
MFQRHNGRGGREGVPLGGGLRENMGGHSGGQGGPSRLFSTGEELPVSFHARIWIFPDPYPHVKLMDPDSAHLVC